MSTDFGNTEIDKEKAFSILKNYANETMYVRSILNTSEDNTYSLKELFTIYTPFKVDSIEIGEDYIYIYRDHLKDRIILNTRNVKSCEETPVGIKIILEKENIYHEIYFDILQK